MRADCIWSNPTTVTNGNRKNTSTCERIFNVHVFARNSFKRKMIGLYRQRKANGQTVSTSKPHFLSLLPPSCCVHRSKNTHRVSGTSNELLSIRSTSSPSQPSRTAMVCYVVLGAFAVFTHRAHEHNGHTDVSKQDIACERKRITKKTTERKQTLCERIRIGRK